MKTDLAQNEKVVKKGAANLQKGLETVGGKLHLTNKRLIFESHVVNIQSGVTEIELSNLERVQKSWTKFLGLIPVFPNSLSVYTKEGQEYQFVLFGRESWADSITSEIKSQ